MKYFVSIFSFLLGFSLNLSVCFVAFYNFQNEYLDNAIILFLVLKCLVVCLNFVLFVFSDSFMMGKDSKAKVDLQKAIKFSRNPVYRTLKILVLCAFSVVGQWWFFTVGVLLIISTHLVQEAQLKAIKSA